MRPIDIRCACGTLFGKQQPDGSLSIKSRDIYRTIKGGVVEGYCRKCGALVRWPNDTMEKVQ